MKSRNIFLAGTPSRQRQLVLAMTTAGELFSLVPNMFPALLDQAKIRDEYIGHVKLAARAHAQFVHSLRGDESRNEIDSVPAVLRLLNDMESNVKDFVTIASSWEAASIA